LSHSNASKLDIVRINTIVIRNPILYTFFKYIVSHLYVVKKFALFICLTSYSNTFKRPRDITRSSN